MPGLAPAAPGFFATRFEQRIRAFLNVCLSPRGVEFIFIAPDTYPKKLIAHAARTSANAVFQRASGARAGLGGIDPCALRMSGRIRAGGERCCVRL
jgi:hypothetical protein